MLNNCNNLNSINGRIKMAFDATAFRSKLQHGGARPNLYEVRMSIPGSPGADEEFTFMCKAASLPGMNVGTATVHYFGRPMNFAGDRTFEDWSVSVINDEDFVVRNAFEAWQNAFAELDHGAKRIENADGVGQWQNLYVNATVTQMGKDGNTRLKSYTFHNMWLTSLGAIELSWDSNDTIEEFSAVLTYDYFTTDKIDKNKSGMGGGGGGDVAGTIANALSGL